MKTFFMPFFMLFLFTHPSVACVAPTYQEAAQFFRHSDEWSRVNSADTQLEHQRKPVDIRIVFSSPGDSEIIWNGSPVNFSSLQVCKTNSANAFVIKSNWPRITLTRMAGGLLQAKALGIPFYFRSSHEVYSR